MVTRTSISERFEAAATNWHIRIIPASLRARLALLAALLLCLSQVAVSAVFYGFTSAWLRSQLDDSLLATGVQVAAALDDGEPLEPDDFRFGVGGDAFLRERRFLVRVFDRQTGEVLSTSPDGGLPITRRARNGSAGYETLITTQGDVVAMRVYTLSLAGDRALAFQVGQSLDAVQQTEMEILRILGVLLIPTAVLALVSGWFVAQRALLPVDAIRRTAQEIGEKDLGRRIDMPLPDDELGRLARTFNAMLGRIEQAFEQQKRFTGDAAHELRTPLSIMQTSIDITLSQERSAAQYREILESIQDEVRRLTRLTVHLLMLARLESNLVALDRQQVDLALVVAGVLHDTLPLAEQKRITIVCELPDELLIDGDVDRLIQLVFNLVENALKFTPEGGSIRVVLQRSAGEARLTIQDSGQGIPAQQLAHIFERFYRADRARERLESAQRGFGLGLAIAQQIARLHGGDIQADSEPGVGTLFTVTLPVVEV